MPPLSSMEAASCCHAGHGASWGAAPGPDAIIAAKVAGLLSQHPLGLGAEAQRWACSGVPAASTALPVPCRAVVPHTGTPELLQGCFKGKMCEAPVFHEHAPHSHKGVGLEQPFLVSEVAPWVNLAMA